MSYPAITVANTIIKKAIDLKIPDLTHLKLQKLVYLAHAWTLAIKDEPLITEAFHAWQYGPVIPILYSYFCKFGNKTINELALMSIDNPDKEVPIRYVYVEPLIEKDDKDINDIIERVIKKYGPWTAAQLVAKTHAKGGPWDITLNNKQKIISNDLIKKDMIELAESINHLIAVLSDRVSRLEQSQRDDFNIITEAYKNREQQKINLRNKYAHGAYFLVLIWSIFLMVVLFLDAIKTEFYLSDKVIIALIVGVTVNIIAILIVVMKNLFPHATENINKNE